MIENRGKMIALKGLLATCLLVNNFSSFGAVAKATAVESDNIVNSDVSEDLTNSDGSEKNLPSEGENPTDEETLSDEDVDQSEEVLPGETPSDEDVGQSEEVLPEETPSDEEVDQPEEVLPEAVPGDEEADESTEFLNEEELLSIESRSPGSGLVQLWQVVPDGQQSKEGKTTSQIMSALQCKPNHNLYPSGGQSEHNTYVNSCYVDDALYLGEEANYYKIYLSGYEGKVPKSQSHWFDLDLNNDGVKVSYEIQTVAYYIPAGSTTYSIQETTEPLDVPELDYYDQYLDKYNDLEEDNIETYSTGTVQSPSYYANENGTLVHYITNNVKKANNYSKVIGGKAPSWMISNVKYYSYDGIYFYTNWRNIKVNGQGAVNQSNPFYNYYQYLPFRSKSNYSANVFDNYTNSNGGSGGKLFDTGQYFYDVQDKYGINGALQYAMGIHESGWGKSSLSINKNNLFGMNATDNNPYGNGTSFPSVEAGINYHADYYVSRGYTNPVSDWRYLGSHVGNKGSGMNVRYASDPFWGEKIAGWYYRFDSTSGLKDYNYYTIGIKQSNSVYNVRSQVNTNSTVLYQTKNNQSNIKVFNYPVLIIGEQNGFYKIKTDTPIVNDKPQSSSTYDWETTNGYIHKDAVTFTNHNNYINPQITPELRGQVQTISLNGGLLKLKGYLYIEGISIPTSDSISQKVKFINIDTGNTLKTLQLKNYYSNSMTNNKGNGNYNYDYAYYNSDLDVTDLPTGRYELKVYTSTKGIKFEEYAQVSSSFNTLNFTKDGKIYVVERVQKDGINTLQLTIYEDTVNMNPEVTSLFSSFGVENGKIVYDGYSYIKGINIVNDKDIIQKIKFTNLETGLQELTFDLDNYYSTAVTKDKNHGNYQYNYDWAKFKGEVDISALPVGEYQVKIYNNAKGIKAETVINFHSSITDMSFESNDKLFSFIREGNTLILKVKNIPLKVEQVHINRLSDISSQNGQLYLNGYSYVKRIDIPNQKDIIQKLKFVDINTGKQVKTYQLSNYYSTAASKDPNHGAGIYNYDWAKFKGYIDVKDLPIGEYYIKIYTNAKNNKYDEIIAVHSGISDFSFKANGKTYKFVRETVNSVSSFKVIVTEN